MALSVEEAHRSGTEKARSPGEKGVRNSDKEEAVQHYARENYLPASGPMD